MIISKSKKANYLTKVSNNITSLYADVTKDKGGNGESFRPHDLLCASLSSCLNISIRMVLDKLQLDYESVVVKVDLDRQDNATDFIYSIEIAGDISDEKKEEVINLAEHCAVHNTLSKKINFIRE